MKKIYETYKPMIHAKAARYALNYGRDFSDVLSEAHEIFVDALKDFDESKASFSTHLWIRLEGMLSNSSKKEKRFAIVGYSFDQEATELSCDSIAEQELLKTGLQCFTDSYQSDFEMNESAKLLSADAQLILSKVFSGELDRTTHKTSISANCDSFRKYTTKNLKWKHSRFWKAWTELKIWYATEFVY